MTKPPNLPIGSRIAFFGPMCAGKTKCADYLVQNYNYKKLSLADKLKSIAYELYGIENKDGEGRKIIQELGDSLRVFDDDVFTKYTLAQMRKLFPYDRVVIDDLRLPREAQLLTASGFICIQVLCDEDVRLARIKALYPNVPEARQSHPTETSWAGIRAHTAVRSVEYIDLLELDELLSGFD